jgi:hypothetical protein
MLTGPAAQQATKLLKTKISDESAGAIIDMVVGDPHEANLLFIETLFKFSPEELELIRSLRDSAANAHASAVSIDKATLPEASLLQEMRKLWDALLNETTYNPSTMHKYLECCMEASALSSDMRTYPGLQTTVGFGFKVAREERGMTQKVVHESHGISPTIVRSIEWGHRDPADSAQVIVYLESLFPSHTGYYQESIKLLLNKEPSRRDFFEHIKRDPLLAIGQAHRS